MRLGLGPHQVFEETRQKFRSLVALIFLPELTFYYLIFLLPICLINLLIKLLEAAIHSCAGKIAVL